MISLHEEVLLKSCESLSFNIGEKVNVFTRMGRPVNSGEVLVVTEQGISLKKDNGDSGFYNTKFYLFIPHDDSDELNIRSGLTKKLDEQGKENKKDEKDEKDNEDEDEEKKDKEVEEPKKEPKEEPKDDDSEEGELDPDKLPDDIKDKVVKVDELDPEAVNKVRVAISDALLDSLRGVDVKEEDIYGIIDEVQGILDKVLPKGEGKDK